jgi:hypothetical protein
LGEAHEGNNKPAEAGVGFKKMSKNIDPFLDRQQ